MEQADISSKSSSTDGRVARINAFMNRTHNVGSDAEDIYAYKAELDVVMSEVEVSTIRWL